MHARPTSLLILFLALGTLGRSDQNGYVGSDVCAGCHKDIAKTQAQTNMARTWQGVATQQLPAVYRESHAEGPAPAIDYQVQRSSNKPTYRVQMPGLTALEFPVETTIGGKRHAISFLFRVPDFEGLPLPRAPLVEGRYIHSVLENGLALELGFPEDKPSTYEAAFGRVLTPKLEQRCLGCHVAPRTLGTRVETGVACENCHGPGRAHLNALASHSPDLGILNPAKLPVAERMRPCSQCHAGSGTVEDPMGDNLLISDQVTALRNSECFRQSGGQITCTNCHNPHQDAPRAVLVARSEKTCLQCHAATAPNHAGLCPVNRVGSCVGCHMPNQIHGAFHLADHWMRVHPEQKVTVPPVRDAAWRTTIAPRHLYLRQIVSDDSGKAAAIRRQLAEGGSFFDLARANSVDKSTGTNGGYIGDVEAEKLDPAYSAIALRLQPGDLSDVIEASGKYLIIQRLPRNFREDAEAIVNQAVELRKQGKQRDAVNELIEALKIYPNFLRALTYVGIIYAQSDKPQIGAGVLEMATRLYPKDQGAHFNLGVAYGAMKSDREIDEYRRTLEIDGDYVPAYLNWGGALYSKGKYEEAIELYRKALDINPLSASLHYSLSVSLEKMNKKEEAAAELLLATKIDPRYALH